MILFSSLWWTEFGLELGHRLKVFSAGGFSKRETCDITFYDLTKTISFSSQLMSLVKILIPFFIIHPSVLLHSRALEWKQNLRARQCRFHTQISFEPHGSIAAFMANFFDIENAVCFATAFQALYWALSVKIFRFLAKGPAYYYMLTCRKKPYRDESLGKDVEKWYESSILPGNLILAPCCWAEYERLYAATILMNLTFLYMGL